MKTGPVLVFPPSNERPVHDAPVRSPSPPLPILGSGSNGKRISQENYPSAPLSTQDAVEVQWNSTNRVLVYEFVNQDGSVVLQIPSNELLSLAQAISKELAPQPHPVSGEGAKNHGH